MPLRLNPWWLILPGALGVGGLARHEWWQDEAYTWLVVGASPTLRSLITSLGFNGHPRPYYVGAWLLHLVWSSPYALALVNLAFALGAIGLFFKSAPVTRVQALLFGLGFFPLYQYGVVVRSYSLLLFLLFAYCHLRVTRPGNLSARLFALALLAQVHLFGLTATCALLAFEWFEQWPIPRWTRREWACVGCVVLSVLLTLWQLTGGETRHADFRVVSASAFLHGIANGFAPNWGAFAGRGQVLLGTVLMLGSVVFFLRSARAIVVSALLGGSIASVCILVYAGFRWHHGFYFIYMVMALWLTSPVQLSGNASRFLTALLGVHVIMGGYALVEDLVRPYSDGELAAGELVRRQLGTLPIVGVSERLTPSARPTGTFTWDIASVQPILLNIPGARAYDPVADSLVAHYTHYADASYGRVMDRAQAERSLVEMSARFGRPIVLVEVGSPIHLLPANTTLLASLPSPLDVGERYTLFLCCHP